jgi:hypothetical protein
MLKFAEITALVPFSTPTPDFVNYSFGWGKTKAPGIYCSSGKRSGNPEGIGARISLAPLCSNLGYGL